MLEDLKYITDYYGIVTYQKKFIYDTLSLSHVVEFDYAYNTSVIFCSKWVINQNKYNWKEFRFLSSFLEALKSVV